MYNVFATLREYLLPGRGMCQPISGISIILVLYEIVLIPNLVSLAQVVAELKMFIQTKPFRAWSCLATHIMFISTSK